MAAIGQRKDIENKVVEITNRIIRGKHARDNGAMRFYQFSSSLKTISAAVTGVGVGNPFLTLLGGTNAAPDISTVAASFKGFPLIFSAIGVGIYIILVSILKLMDSGNLQIKSAKSMALFEIMTKMEMQLRNRLEVPDPMVQLNLLYGDLLTQEINYSEIMPEYDKYSEETTILAAQINKRYCQHWNDSVPELERRG